MSGSSITVTSVAQLNSAIVSATTLTSGNTLTIDIDGSIALGTTPLEAFNVASGAVVDLIGINLIPSTSTVSTNRR